MSGHESVVGNHDPFPRDMHNIFVVVIVLIVIAWIVKVGSNWLNVFDLHSCMTRSNPLPLDGLSVYAGEFHMLIRQHFNQILRIRCTVPPKPVPRHSLSVHLHPESIDLCTGQDGAFGVEFTMDSSVPCCVRLFWGVSVSACNDFVQQRQQTSADSASKGWPNPRSAIGGKSTTGISTGDAVKTSRWPKVSKSGSSQESLRSLLDVEQMRDSPGTMPASSDEDANCIFNPCSFALQSRDFFLPAANNQKYVTPPGDLVQPVQLSHDLTAPWFRDGNATDDACVIPLAIVVTAQRQLPRDLGTVQGRAVLEDHGQVSLVRFRRHTPGSGPQVPEVIRQLAFGEHAPAHEVSGIFGFEDSEGDTDCMICYSRIKNILMLPCRHCAVCHQCLRSLRDEKCPLCRAMFTSYVILPISRSQTPPEASTESPTPEGTFVTALASTETSSPAPSELASAHNENASDTPPSTAGSSSDNRGSQNPCGEDTAGQASSQPVARQAREVLFSRPRGLAPALSKSQGLRLSGRARYLERSDADTPLLRDGGSTMMTLPEESQPLSEYAPGSFEPVTPVQEPATEETHMMTDASDAV